MTDWRRLHPVSPVVRGGRATIAVAILLLPAALGGRSLADSLPQVAIAGVLVLLGFVSWLVTRWCVDGDDLRIETGVLRRQSLRYPLSQVQAIDIVRPGLARVFRVAELRLRMAGATGGSARLAYLPEPEAEQLRERLLALARGARQAEHGSDTVEEPAPGQVLASVPPVRLAASVLVSDVGLFAELVLLAIVLTAIFSTKTAVGALSGSGAVWVVSVVTLVWRRFNQEYRMTVTEAPDGLRLHSGLVALTSETIRPGRVQAVKMVEPLLWRRLGWARLEVDLAGRQRSKGEGQAQRGQLRAVLPVGSRAVALELAERILREVPRETLPPPRRALLKSPLRYRFLSYGSTATCVVATSGRLRRVTSWVPLGKVQSFRRVQGPLQRRLRLASVHLDTAGRGVHATLRDRDVEEADGLLWQLADAGRAARRQRAGLREVQ